jgi:alkylation response protein AidB-like acyl-CoA dehydrogenase
VFVPSDRVIGQLGQGWRQVTSELSLERSGPDRFLSSFVLLVELVRELGQSGSERAAEAIGRLVSHIHILRRMSLSIANMIENGRDPALQASLVKDLGAVLEQDIPEICRLIVDVESPAVSDDFRLALAHTTLIAPAFSLRGGTREILRGMIARGLGLR